MNPLNETRYLTPYAPLSADELPFGREDDLSNLGRLLALEGHLAVVKGLGGIGKTTLAHYYIHKHGHDYRHIAWLKVARGLVAGFAQDTHFHACLGIDLSQIKEEEERFRQCLLAMQNLNGPNLLVLDNAMEDVGDRRLRSLLPKGPQWHVLLTSRFELNGFAKLRLERLPNDAARQLFERSYQKPVADADWKELYALTHGHALSLELFGKTLHANLGTLSPADLVQRIKEHRLDDEVIQRIVATPHGEGQTTVMEHLLFAFQMNAFGEYSIWLLKQFVGLPLMGFDVELLKTILRIPDEDKTKLMDALALMERTGWLQREDDAFSIHPMVQQAAYYQLHPTDKDVATLVKSVTGALYLDQAKDNPVDKFPFIPFGDALLENIAWGEEEAKNELSSKLGIVYIFIGNYLKAKELLEKALKFTEQKFGSDNAETVGKYTNLALALQKLGDYVGANVLLKKAIAFAEQNFGPDHPITALRYSNFALVLQDLGDYTGAKALLEKAMASDEQNFGPDHSTTAGSYCNLAMVLRDLGDYAGAKVLLKKAMASYEENFGPDHPNTAVSYSNLALVLQDLGDYAEAKALLEKAMVYAEENFGTDHPTTANCYNNLAVLYFDIGQFKEAIAYFQKAYQPLLKLLGEEHPNIKAVKNGLAQAQAKLAEKPNPWQRLKNLFKK